MRPRHRSSWKFGIISIAALISGCASIARGRSQEVKIESEDRPYFCMLPNGGQAFPPATIKLTRRGPHRIVCLRTIEGDAKRTEFSVTNFESESDWGAGTASGHWRNHYLVGDVILGGFVLPIVDILVGGPYILSPTTIGGHNWMNAPPNVEIKGSY